MYFKRHMCAGGFRFIARQCECHTDGESFPARVTGKHGGINDVLVDVAPVVLRRLNIGDRFQIHSIGLGLRLLDYPDVTVLNCAPGLLRRRGLQERDGRPHVCRSPTWCRWRRRAPTWRRCMGCAGWRRHGPMPPWPARPDGATRKPGRREGGRTKQWFRSGFTV